ncbi:hypothetical protein Bbelb_252320 [Branchiostoma belcheri]|nr:hypothetical protein Bbelb_252320 [Branchiostoma belcheri]
METTSLTSIVAESCGELCCEGQQPVQVFSTDGMRLVMTEAPGDQIHIGVLGQLTAVMTLNPTRPDVRVLRNLVTGNFSPVQTSKSDDLKTHIMRHVPRVSCPDWKKPVMTGDSSPNQISSANLTAQVTKGKEEFLQPNLVQEAPAPRQGVAFIAEVTSDAILTTTHILSKQRRLEEAQLKRDAGLTTAELRSLMEDRDQWRRILSVSRVDIAG